MKLECGKPLIIPIIIAAIILLIGVVIINTGRTSQSDANYCMCCNNQTCTDTYYSFESGDCIFVLSGTHYLPTNETPCMIYAGEYNLTEDALIDVSPGISNWVPVIVMTLFGFVLIVAVVYLIHRRESK